MTCRWSPEAADYLADGEPCRRDDYGDRTRHCTARRTCSQHIGEGELTCARCVGRTRKDIRQIVERAALMLPEAIVCGVDSEAANMAGPAADYRVFSARRNIDRGWIMDHIHKSARGWCEDPECTRRHFKTDKGDRWHKRGIENAFADLIPDDDEWHPGSVLTRWAQMLTEDYGIERPAKWDLSNAAAMIDRLLHRVAQDAGQDYPLLARELRRCRAHLESVLRDSLSPERGAPCPECAGRKVFVRLVREYPHYCDDPDCEQFHWDTDEKDRWVCPKDRTHAWDLESYSRWVEDRKAVGA